MTAPRTIAFRHGLDQLYVKFCRLRDGVPLDASAFEGPLEPVAVVAGLGRAWSRAKLVRAGVVIGTVPLLAWLASSLGLPLWSSVCVLGIVGPLAWFALSALLAFRTMRGQADQLTQRIEAGQAASQVPRDVTLEIADDRLVFVAGDVTLSHPWAELTQVTAGADGVVLELTLVLANGEGVFRHYWTIPGAAFASVEAMSELVGLLEEKRGSKAKGGGA